METWKQFEANPLTHSAAHHLCAIQELGTKCGGWTRVTDIAHDLGVTRGTVSINLRSLKKRGLVVTGENRMVKLSPVGRVIVRNVRAKKTVVKSFLTTVLGVSERSAEVDSCKIEHLLSQRTGLRLARWLEQFRQGRRA
ncbi:MAG: metal-dependent transcriptional regulator [Verrucomicrobiota bacterium]